MFASRDLHYSFGPVKLSFGLTSALIIVDFSKTEELMRRLREVYFHGREINLWRIKKYRNQQERLTTRDQELKISSRIRHESFENLKTEINWPLEGQKWTKRQRLRSFWVLVQAQKVPKVMILIKFYKKGKGMTTHFLTHFRTIFNRHTLSSCFWKYPLFEPILLKSTFLASLGNFVFWHFSKYPFLANPQNIHFWAIFDANIHF